MRIKLRAATPDRAAAIAALRLEVAKNPDDTPRQRTVVVRRHRKGVLFDMRNAAVYVATRRNKVSATLTLCTKKPWAIDRKYFSSCKRPLYLLSMAVHPDWQRQGIGQRCIDEAKRLANKWPGDAIFLDAYDAEAGAGEFYRKCGFREVGRATYRNAPLIYFEMLLSGPNGTA